MNWFKKREKKQWYYKHYTYDSRIVFIYYVKNADSVYIDYITR